MSWGSPHKRPGAAETAIVEQVREDGTIDLRLATGKLHERVPAEMWRWP